MITLHFGLPPIGEFASAKRAAPGSDRLNLCFESKERLISKQVLRPGSGISNTIIRINM
jgi:hypothetical protein